MFEARISDGSENGPVGIATVAARGEVKTSCKQARDNAVYKDVTRSEHR